MRTFGESADAVRGSHGSVPLEEVTYLKVLHAFCYRQSSQRDSWLNG
jgi:hypothetical protein